MTITIHNTNRIVDVDGVKGRIWEGKTESGIAVCCVITRIAVDQDSDSTQFERELKETKPPSDAATACFPLRMIL